MPPTPLARTANVSQTWVCRHLYSGKEAFPRRKGTTVMLHLYVTLQVLGVNLQQRARKTLTVSRDERGSVTLEQVLITAALAALAIGVVAAIGVAVRSQIAKL